MDIGWFLAVSALIFAVGAAGVLTRRSPLVILLCIELMLNAANLALIAFARMHGNHDGQIFAIIVMVVAACEVVVGLGLARDQSAGADAAVAPSSFRVVPDRAAIVFVARSNAGPITFGATGIEGSIEAEVAEFLGPTLFLVGHYLDILVRDGASFKFRQRLAVYDNHHVTRSLIVPV